MFTTEKCLFDLVTKEQLTEIKKVAKKFRGKVESVESFWLHTVRVTFNDRFPESFAQHDKKEFLDKLSFKPITFTGIETCVFFS